MFVARHQRQGEACRRLTAGGSTARLLIGDGALALRARTTCGREEGQVASMAYDYSDNNDHYSCSVSRDDRARCKESLALVARLRQVERLLAEDSDAAALALDGILWSLVVFAFERAGLHVPSREAVFESLDAWASPVCWRLRLALRAPNAHARLIHAWALMDAVGAMRSASSVSGSSRAAG